MYHVLLKSLRVSPTPVDSPLLINWDVPDAEDAGNARDATTQHTATHPIFASRDVGNAGNAAG